MINHFEIPAFLAEKLPEMKEELIKVDVLPATYHPYKALHCLRDFTLKNAKELNMTVLKRCLKTAEELYRQGNSTTKNGVENVFIYSFSILFSTCNSRRERTKMQSMMPVYLYSAYVHQILKSNY